MSSSEKIIKILTKIDEEIPYIDIKPYSHNIIGLQLDMLEKLTNEDNIKKVVKEKGLDKLGWGHILEEEEEEEELLCLGFRPQNRIGECDGCKMVCQECENLMIVETDEDFEIRMKEKRM